jgi:hypothetical protein
VTRRAGAWIAVVLGALVLAAVATAASGTPKPATMALTSEDLGGAKVLEQGDVGALKGLLPNSGGYARFFVDARVEKVSIPVLIDFVLTSSSDSAASQAVNELRREIATPAGRRALIKSSLGGFTSSSAAKDAKVRLVRARGLNAGDAGVEIELAFTAKGKTEFTGIVAVAVGPALSVVIWISENGNGLSPSVALELAQLSAARMSAALVPPPVNTEAPALADAPVVGVTDSVLPGSWTGATSFRYQWERCNAAGGNCVAIDGATSTSYPVSTEDIDTSLVVVVTATNKSGSTTVVTAPSGLVGG